MPDSSSLSDPVTCLETRFSVLSANTPPPAAPTTVADTAKPWVADCVALARNN